MADDFVELIEIEVAEQVRAGLFASTTHTAQQVVAFIQIVEKNLGGASTKLLEANTRLAKGAQNATIASYKANGKKTPSYRLRARDPRNVRFANGLLLSALMSDNFAIATDESILFANTALMTEKARQWHRLNFGAGGAAGGNPPTFRVTWSNLAIASFGFDEEPNPPFRLPRGFWLDSEGNRVKEGGMFYPIGEVPRGAMAKERNRRPNPVRMTKGIEAQRFLDAGLLYIADNLTLEYERIYSEIFRESGGHIEGLFVYSPRPWGRRLSYNVEIT